MLLSMNIGSSETTREAPYSVFLEKTVTLVTCFNFQEYVSNSLPEHKKSLDSSFFEWFIGFSEGDGCFFSRIEDNRVRLSFEIGQKDPQLIHKIRSTLGFGTVSSFTRKSEIYWRYKVEDKKGLQRLMNLFNGNLVLPKKYLQFQHWVTTGKAICPPNFSFKLQRVIVSLQTGWLAGFIEAEGCFYAAFRAKNMKKEIISADSAKHVQEVVLSNSFDSNDSSNLTKTFKQSEWGFDQKFTLTQKDVYGELLILQEILILFQSTGKCHLAKKPDCYRIEFCSLKAHSILIEYLAQFPLLGLKKIAFRRWWRVYLQRQKPKNEEFTFKTIIKLKKLCSAINAQSKKKSSSV